MVEVEARQVHRTESKSATTKSPIGINRKNGETRASRLRRALAQEKKEPTVRIKPKISSLAWCRKGFDVRNWQKSISDYQTRPCTTMALETKNALSGVGVGHDVRALTPAEKGCDGLVGLTIPHNRAQLRREAKREMIVTGWLSQLGINTEVNKKLVDIVARRVVTRLKMLGLEEQAADKPVITYDEVLHRVPGEWSQLSQMARVAISLQIFG